MNFKLLISFTKKNQVAGVFSAAGFRDREWKGYTITNSVTSPENGRDGLKETFREKYGFDAEADK